MKTYPKNLDRDSQVLDVWKEIEHCFQDTSKAPDYTGLKKLGIAVCLNAINNSEAKLGDTVIRFAAYRRAANRVPDALKGEVMNVYGDDDWFDLDAYFSKDRNGDAIETALYNGKSFETLWTVWRSWASAADEVSYQLERKDG